MSLKKKSYKPHERMILDDMERVRVSDIIFPVIAGLVLLVLGTGSGALWTAGFLAILPLVIRASDFLAVYAAKDYSQSEWEELQREAMVRMEEDERYWRYYYSDD